MSRSLGDRMKRYEAVTNICLMKRTPVILRIDGAHFHTFTRGLKKPYDAVFLAAMQETCKALVENISGAKFGYVQSDEISILLTDYDTLETEAWFDYRLEKLCSTAAAMATVVFNRKMVEITSIFTAGDVPSDYKESVADVQSYANALSKMPYFDCRAFNLPKEEVANYFLWRQRDCIRNSISGLAQSLYSTKELQGKNSSDMEKMIADKGKPWSEYPIVCKRGTCCYRVDNAGKSEIYLNKEMVQLNDKVGREFIDKFVFIEEN